MPPPPPPAPPPLARKCQPHGPDWHGVQRPCVAGRVPAGGEGVGSVLRTAGAVGQQVGRLKKGGSGGLLKSCGAPSPLGCTPTAEGLSLTPPLAAEWTPQGCDPWRSPPSYCNTPSCCPSPALLGGRGGSPCAVGPEGWRWRCRRSPGSPRAMLLLRGLRAWAAPRGTHSITAPACSQPTTPHGPMGGGLRRPPCLGRAAAGRLREPVCSTLNKKVVEKIGGLRKGDLRPLGPWTS